MKIKFLILLFISVFMLSACSKKGGVQNGSLSGETQNTASSSEKINIRYSYMDADWPVYENAHKLIATGNIVVLGKVTGISFQTLDMDTAYPPTEDSDKEDCFLYTIYDVEVLTSYKGTAAGAIKIRMLGGLKDVYFEEQLAALDGSSEKIIPLMNGRPQIDIGQTYLFVLYQYKDTMPTPVNLEQGVYRIDNPLKKDVHSYVSPKEIISYFGEDKWNAFTEDHATE